MSYPGSNILQQALRVIAQDSFSYSAYVSRETNSIGLDVVTYADPVPAKGSVQAVPRKLYEQLGLNLQRTYFNFFLPQSIVDVNRDVSSDYFTWNGNIYTCESITPWYWIDGWVEVLTIFTPTAN